MKFVWWVSGLLVLVLLGWVLSNRLGSGSSEGPASGGTLIAPVEVAPVRREMIELRRVFSGTLESPARFVVAPKVGGRVVRLAVELADPVENGQVVAELDNEEFEQAVVQALAELEVARANLVEARSNLEIAKREMNRISSLQERHIATDSQVDAAKAQLLTREAAVEVAKAQVTRAEASLEGARIRLGYTKVTANWSGDGSRFVAERHVNEGGTIAANTPIFSIVELNPIIAVVFVTERDYGLMRAGQPAVISTDAFPGVSFLGSVSRVAPVFNQASRQARVELEVQNPEQQLKPGMFVHAEVVLDRVPDAVTVPLSALVTRAGQTGLFVVDGSGKSVIWKTVKTGIRQDDRVQVFGEGVEGRVVTMGQQLIDNGSPITIPEHGSGLSQGRSTE